MKVKCQTVKLMQCVTIYFKRVKYVISKLHNWNKSDFCETSSLKWNVAFESEKCETEMLTGETNYLKYVIFYFVIVKYIGSKLCNWNRSDFCETAYLEMWNNSFQKSEICYLRNVQLN